MIMVSGCLPSDALSQHLPSYLGFSYLRRGVSLHGCSSKVQPQLLSYNSNASAFDIVPEVSEPILSSFHSLYFILLFISYFHYFIFQFTALFFCFRYSALDSFLSIFNFCNCVVCMFNSFRSFLIDSYILFILFSRFLIIFTIIILNYLSGSLPIFSSFIWASVCSLTCVVFLCFFIIFF